MMCYNHLSIQFVTKTVRLAPNTPGYQMVRWAKALANPTQSPRQLFK
jgi:hypothetical protein